MPFALRQIEEGAEHLGRVFDAAGIVRRHQNDGAGAGGDQPLRHAGFGDQPRPGRQRHRPDALHVEPHFVVEIPGGWEDHFIPRPGQRREDRAEGLIAALGDRDLTGRDLAAIGGRPLRRDLGAQGGQAEHRPVKMRRRIVQRRLRQRLSQSDGRRLHRCRLAHVDQRPVGREGDTFQPTPRLHDRRREGGGHVGVERQGHRVRLLGSLSAPLVQGSPPEARRLTAPRTPPSCAGIHARPARSPRGRRG